MAGWIKRHFDTAKHFASFSKDTTKCGCIAVSEDNRVLAQGWNGFPRGTSDSKDRYADREAKLNFVVHSEQNCIYNAAYSGISLKDSLFFVHAPIHVCNDCAKGIIQSGAQNVFMCIDTNRVSDMWLDKWLISKQMFLESDLFFSIFKEVNGEYREISNSVSERRLDPWGTVAWYKSLQSREGSQELSA